MNLILALIVNGILPASIPLRCLAAFEVAESEYRQCRTPSMRGELEKTCMPAAMTVRSDPCSLDRALAWEIDALKMMKKAVETKK